MPRPGLCDVAVAWPAPTVHHRVVCRHLSSGLAVPKLMTRTKGSASRGRVLRCSSGDRVRVRESPERKATSGQRACRDLAGRSAVAPRVFSQVVNHTPSPRHSRWIAAHGNLFHSSNSSDHEEAMKRGRLALAEAHGQGDLPWEAHCLHELGALDFDKFRKYERARLRFAAADLLWRNAGEIALSASAKAAFDLAQTACGNTVRLSQLHGMLERNRRGLEALKPSAGQTILDAGCGDGNSTLFLSDRLPDGRVIAIDLDAEKLKHCRELVSDMPGSVAVVESDMRRLPQSIPRVDGVFAAASLEQSADFPTALLSLSARLRVGGRISGYSNGRPWPNVIRAFQREGAEVTVQGKPILDAADIRLIFDAVGFRSYSVETRNSVETFNSRTDLRNTLKARYDFEPLVTQVSQSLDPPVIETEWHFFSGVRPNELAAVEPLLRSSVVFKAPGTGTSPALRPNVLGPSPSAHRSANPELAARCNIEYQSELRKWEALPWWQRKTVKRPEPPNG